MRNKAATVPPFKKAIPIDETLIVKATRAYQDARRWRVEMRGGEGGGSKKGAFNNTTCDEILEEAGVSFVHNSRRYASHFNEVIRRAGPGPKKRCKWREKAARERLTSATGRVR